ncbi:hypothetical protein Q765_05990 [Flavobacterium rivuli WB 3.3-2 = DSM 21788]|uniref:Secretion system C-terminal sorting domain-containing protein n=1 Tax=Flavobacterium rivuli WB 3.3-2 = DSM 21788 TaxID=1121895 RepID=A0A0A2M3M1_9FLAO|nr:T9SS type A sorting domain-containing protein [Flavobacterium rivuli]KGO87217.1 hypothetical protein Q765_05990 [Flavobacterium rivuli WB 3.3-2 = DSM 21788]
MKKKLLFATLLLAGSLSAFAQESCANGTVSNNTANGENISAGDVNNEYSGATDFDVPFGKVFTASSINFNVLKGPADVTYVNITFYTSVSGEPGDVIETFTNVVPTSQELAYEVTGEAFDAYTITVDLPTDHVFPKGKYFVELAAAPGDETAIGWEIGLETQTSGVFDFVKNRDRFGNIIWGGGGYYSKVFQIMGECADSGETLPDYGEECNQSNASNNHQGGVSFFDFGQILSLADDFVVPANTTFTLTDFTLHTMLLGRMNNATIKIRSSQFSTPSTVLYTFTNKGPEYTQYDGTIPVPGSDAYTVAVQTNFSFDDEPIELSAGTYFIEVIPTPNYSDYMVWETTTLPGIGGYGFTSGTDGNTWNVQTGKNFVFDVKGFCRSSLGTDAPKAVNLTYYPNPVKDVLQITSQKLVTGVAIHNIQGREINGYSLNNNTVNMQSLASGLYIVKAQLEDGTTEVFKVLKE